MLICMVILPHLFCLESVRIDTERIIFITIFVNLIIFFVIIVINIVIIILEVIFNPF